MKLKDLKQGMVLKLRNGGVIIALEDGSYYNLKYEVRPNLVDRYNNGLTHKENENLDIMEVSFGDKVVFKRNESRWFVPEFDENYIFISSHEGIISFTNTEDRIDNEIFNKQRVFKTREEAEKRLRQQKATLSVERWIAENDVEVDINNSDVKKWSFGYDIDRKKFVMPSSYSFIYNPKQFILSSEEKAEQLIKEREKELKIMLGVEE